MILPCGKLYVLILSDLSPVPILLFLSLDLSSSFFCRSNSYIRDLKILRARIYELERQKKESERSKDRKNKIGTGDRSERIRTYNFPQGRVTDHRINFTLHKLAEFMEGEIFDEMIENLNLQAQEEKLNNLN